MSATAIPGELQEEVSLLWDFLQMHHEVGPADLAIGLGGHDPTVPQVAVDLYHRRLVPCLVFTGANAPTTVDRFPRGEAVHFGEIATEHGVPVDAVLLETHARYTAENFTLTRELLTGRGITPASAIVVSRPAQQRRAFAIAAKLWPDLTVTCASTNLPLPAYLNVIGDTDLVINTMVGDAVRLTTDVEDGNSIPVAIPTSVEAAINRLISAGYARRLR